MSEKGQNTDHLNALLEPIVSGLGFELIRVSYGGSPRAVLQVMAERPDGTMKIEDCTRLSREISTILDVEDPISGHYDLEVSSPGIDRPLTRLKDFENYKGFEGKVVLKVAQNNRRRYKGELLGLDGEKIMLKCDDIDEIVGFDLDDIQSAKLVLTDELIKASMPENE